MRSRAVIFPLAWCFSTARGDPALRAMLAALGQFLESLGHRVIHEQ